MLLINTADAVENQGSAAMFAEGQVFLAVLWAALGTFEAVSVQAKHGHGVALHTVSAVLSCPVPNCTLLCLSLYRYNPKTSPFLALLGTRDP